LIDGSGHQPDTTARRDVARAASGYTAWCG
jgi:hypothetical protein